MNIRILANDGLEAGAIKKLEEHGFEVLTSKVPQEELVQYINENHISALIVRSATKVRKELIDACPNLYFIGRGGVGMDNIDVEYARACGKIVTNTPAASTNAVAEMVFAHLFTLARFLHLSNREMPEKGHTDFAKLKKSYSAAFELRGKTIGIIGFGRIGQATAKIALGLGMKVLPYARTRRETELELDFLKTGDTFTIAFETVDLDEVYANADIISLHVPMPEDGKPLLDAAAFSRMKPGVIIINASRGGVVDEQALLEALESGQVGAAGLDVFENEPQPNPALLSHPRISVSPHVGGSTVEAQERIGTEMADYLIAYFS